MPEYILTAKTGYTLDEAIEQTSQKNATIVKYESGLRKEYIEWNLLTAHIYSPKPDPRFFKQQHIVTRSGEQVTGKDIPPGMLTAGMNPFYQIIYHIILRGKVTTIEDIVRSMLAEERVFSESDEDAIDIIKAIIETMHDGPYYLLKHAEKWKVGYELPKAYHLVEYRRGYDPFEYYIMQFIENHGMASVEEIYGYIMEYLQWLKTPTKIDYYINRLVKKGNIIRIQRNFYRFNRPLESNK